MLEFMGWAYIVILSPGYLLGENWKNLYFHLFYFEVICLLGIIFIITESPRYLISKGKVNECV